MVLRGARAPSARRSSFTSRRWYGHGANFAPGTRPRAADHLLTLLPFEPPYFAKVGLPATYVGHPVVEG